jgi:hypothetical protein
MAPLGIPGDTLVTITMALIPLMGPLLALANILFNCALLLPLDPLFSDAPL